MMTSLLNIEEGTATLLAAIIAAIFSFFTLLSIKPKEIRAANRKTLEPYIYDLSDSIHQLIAISNIIIKTKTEEGLRNWREKAEIAKEKLKDIRPKIRYSLWGLEDYILSLTKLPDFTLYTFSDIEVAKEVVKKGTQFGDSLDNCIRKCYSSGRTPRFYELWRLKYYNWRFIKVRNKYKTKNSN
ncbi:hypothetical protein [Elizabethkingia meningoseptica]|uniref:hypothetical protein n=1 Tax=Elizabethkingia meningoseptica TaxID=238 RepID=UPI0023AEE407|nr:hypothetical protein [Elizabethkingia meningoseptica]MDE5492244.1 hypothetical protein [Elizabethkingia meningoseptica]